MNSTPTPLSPRQPRSLLFQSVIFLRYQVSIVLLVPDLLHLSFFKLVDTLRISKGQQLRLEDIVNFFEEQKKLYWALM